MFRATGGSPPTQGPTASCGLLVCQAGRESRTMAVIHLAGVGRRATARQAELTVSDKRTFHDRDLWGRNHEKTAGVGGQEGTLGDRRLAN